jgi:vancomycin permeability regulator SanA
MTPLKKFLIPFAGIFCLAFSCALAISIDGLTDDPQSADVGIVLGSQVLPNGRPSLRLQARLDKTIELYNAGRYEHVIVSGGIGKEGFSEAAVMADYLVDHGALPRNAILRDENGNTTRDTASNSQVLMAANGYESAIVITQFFHVSRSKFALRRAGIETVHGAHPAYFEWRDIYSIARETLALPTYWLEDRISSPCCGRLLSRL